MKKKSRFAEGGGSDMDGGYNYDSTSVSFLSKSNSADEMGASSNILMLYSERAGAGSESPEGKAAQRHADRIDRPKLVSMRSRSGSQSLASPSGPEYPRAGRARSGSLVPENSQLPSWPQSPGANILEDMSLSKRLTDDDSLGGGTGSGNGGVRRVGMESTELENLAFLLISFGYMVPWTSLGSLISYFKHTYNVNFYNKLYCAYYLPVLPVAFLQHRYDSYFDAQLGSRNAYMTRGAVSFAVMAGVLVGMVWWRDQVC